LFACGTPFAAKNAYRFKNHYFRKEPFMSRTTPDLASQRCVPCEGGVPALTEKQIHELLPCVPQWKLSSDGKRIRREWRVQDFTTGLDFFQRIAQIAEKEDHHPDLHLVGYRNVTIEIWTHAVGGLTENDFILAAKIDQLPIALKT
jgi:4a-hydroxytetrahydrobiopterin dehydratase